jgi:hypothetical protein
MGVGAFGSAEVNKEDQRRRALRTQWAGYAPPDLPTATWSLSDKEDTRPAKNMRTCAEI